jgi:hypothetical protein
MTGANQGPSPKGLGDMMIHPIPYPTNPFSNELKMCYLTVPGEHQLFLMSRLAPLVTKRIGKAAAAISNKS